MWTWKTERCENDDITAQCAHAHCCFISELTAHAHNSILCYYISLTATYWPGMVVGADCIRFRCPPVDTDFSVMWTGIFLKTDDQKIRFKKNRIRVAGA